MNLANITTNHPASRYGNPVAMDTAGDVMTPGDACRELRRHLHWSARRMAQECGVSVRTVQGWEGGRPIPAAGMNVLAKLLGC